MRVSILLLGAILVAIYTINVTAEPRHHRRRGPPKGSAAPFSYGASAYFGKSRSNNSAATLSSATNSKTRTKASYSPSTSSKSRPAESSLSNINSKARSTPSSSYALYSKRSPKTNIPLVVNSMDSSPSIQSAGFDSVPTSTTESPMDSCGVNEEWNVCGRGPCEQPSCLNFGKPRNCTLNGGCVAGCTCRKGYYRNNSNQCVRPNECENNVCPAMNEEISQCVLPCRETCANMGKGLVCNSAVCNEGCDCRTGYFRNSTGSCVAPNNCDCPNNQHLELCFNKCPTNICDAIGILISCPPLNPNTCKPACTCPRPLYMNNTRVCVPVSSCPPQTCRANEIYSHEQWCSKEKCGSEDEPCNDAFFTTRIDKPPICTCRTPDYCRNANGICVVNTGTNRCPKPNTVYKECAKPASQQTCEIIGQNFEPVTSCSKGCECVPGMYRNRKNECVPEEKCEQNICPAMNEEISECVSPCRETCATMGQGLVCNSTVCTEGCDCRTGYFRNSTGSCVLPSDCGELCS